MKTYILRTRETEVDLVGPFTSVEAAAEWGASPVHNPKDDPCWQVVRLSDADVGRPLALVSPY